MDWKKLTGETKQNFAKFHKETPTTFEGFGVMGKDAKKDGHLSEKTKEFIALGISIAVRCESCIGCLLYTSPSPRDKRQSRMPSSA